ncbi:MAG: DUF2256 domain-containing protein [Phormidesmis sp. RL_2_1]|nr:DUF2256 domain-containing protein [Phormidesmis sp. RL_2_1]
MCTTASHSSFSFHGSPTQKSDLPIKRCLVCGKPFTWRKKWAQCWDEVKYCSERCRRRRHQAGDQSDNPVR